MSSHTRCIALAILLAVPASAQLTPYRSIPVSAAQQTHLEATIISIREPSVVHSFSTFTKDWYDLAVSTSASIHGYDSHVIIEDGMQLYGFGSRECVYRPLALSAPNPNFVSAPMATWLTAVIDGNDVHFFSAFTGDWASVSFTNPPNVSVDKHVALATDGTLTVGYSAVYGTTVALGQPGVISVQAAGYAGYAEDGTQVHLYSSTRHQWTSVAGGAGTRIMAPTARAATIVLQDTQGYRFWSAYTNDVRSITTTGGEMVYPSDHATLILDGNTAYAFSSARGTLTTQTFQNAPVVSATSAYYQIIDDGMDRYAFSGLRGAFAAPFTYTFPSVLYTHALSSAAVTEEFSPAGTHFYSALANAWLVGPTVSGASISLTYGGAALTDPSGSLYGYSALHHSLTRQNGVVPTQTFQFGGNFCAQDDDLLWAWNAQIPAWRMQRTSAPVTNLRLHHQAIIAEAGNDIYFYGTYDDRWTHVALSAPPSSIDRADQLGFVDTGTEVYGFGGSGQTQAQSVFPEFYRVLNRSSRADWNVAGEPGAFAALILGGQSTYLPLQGLGMLYVDPATAGVFPLPNLPSVGCLDISFQVPAAPYFAGVMISGQAAILPPGGNPYLTNVHRVMIF